MNITAPIRRLARVNPSAIAVIRANHAVVSYLDFDRMIDAAAVQLTELGIVAGQVVGLAISGPDEFTPLVVALALARMGATTADIALPAERMDICLLPEAASMKQGVRCVSLDAAWRAILASTKTRPIGVQYPNDSAVCRIFASSGSTGTAKFAAITHDTIARRLFSNWLSMGPAEPVHICAVSMGITWGFSSVLRTFWAGKTLALTNPAHAVASIERHGVNSMVIAPISLQKIVAAMPDGAVRPPSLKVIEVGGSLLPTRLYDLVGQKLCHNIVTYYGAMETGGVASGLMSALRRDGRSVGHVHAGVEVQAVDANDKPLPASAEGTLRFRSDNNIVCYLGEVDSSAHAFRDGWFYSGDVGAVSDDGILTINGRNSDFINSGGNKVSPHIIEDVLMSLPQVTEAAAFGVPDSMGVVRIWAAIVADVRIETAMLKAICHEKLAEKSPKFILQLKGLPRNANGKVVRDELVKFALTQQF